MKKLLDKSEHRAWLAQEFAIQFADEIVEQMGAPVYKILRAGPENEYYKDAWEETKRTMEIDGMCLHETENGLYLKECKDA